MDVAGLRSIRALPAESLRGITAAEGIGEPPVFELVDPRDLFVEEGYQREVGANGIKLVRKIYAAFDWSRFKPPVCVRIPEWDGVLVCIDGQHTAIAAASHPEILKVPVMIVAGVDAAARAGAFVGHNRDRLGLTQMAIYYGEVAAGDPVALEIQKACEAAGAEILQKSINLKNRLPPGKTIAVGTIRGIARNKGEHFLTRVLKVLVAAGRGPIKADEIAATALVLESAPASWSVDVVHSDLVEVVKSRSSEAWAASVAQELAEKGGSLPVMLARAWSDQIGFGLEPSLAPPGANPSGSRPSIGNAARMMARRPPPIKKPEPRYAAVPVPAPKPPAAPKPAPVAAVAPPAPPPKAPEPTKQVAGVDQSRVIERNGVRIDLLTRELTHRARTIRVPSDDGIRLVATLARVMPALLDEARVIRSVFGSLPADGGHRLRDLVKAEAPALADVLLEVKFLAKIGVRLNDLGG
jgi:hypothetical protein